MATHLERSIEHHSPKPAASSAQVATTDDVRITTPAKVCGMGHRMKRKEDPRFIQGKGSYVDDVKLPGMLYMDIVRSPYAHAKILKHRRQRRARDPRRAGGDHRRGSRRRPAICTGCRR